VKQRTPAGWLGERKGLVGAAIFLASAANDFGHGPGALCGWRADRRRSLATRSAAVRRSGLTQELIDEFSPRSGPHYAASKGAAKRSGGDKRMKETHSCRASRKC
jgi:hypothetical protein